MSPKSARREQRIKARREEIVRKAVESFQQHGYHNTTIEDIARKLDLTKGSIYYYVEGKQDLLFEAHRFAMGLLLRGLEEISSSTGSPQVKLERAIRHHIRSVIDELSLATMLLQQEYSLSPSQRRKIVSLRDEYERLFRGLIQEGIAKGAFHPVDVRIIGFAILGALNWMPHWFSHSGPLSKEEIADMFVEYLVGGLERNDRAADAAPSGWMAKLFRIDGRAVVVTGAASRIGQVIARGLAVHGAKLALIDREMSGLERVASSIRAAGGDADTFCADAARAQDVEALRDQIVKRFGRIDGLVHPVGVRGHVSILETDEATWDRVVSANLKETFLVSRELAGVMVPQREGRMVLLSSSGALTGLYELIRTLGAELAPYGITVNAIGPGLPHTAITKGVVSEQREDARKRRTGFDSRSRLQNYVGPTIFLLSPAGANFTGQMLAVNGGGYRE